MKSEHRHELKTNDLGKIVAQATPFFERHSNSILIGLGVVIAIAVISILLANRTGTSTAGWTAMLQAQLSNSTEKFAEVAGEYPNTSAGDWASLIEAESYIENGIRSSFTDRVGANSDINKAKEILQGLSSKSGAPEEMRKRALYALARAAEVTTDGNTAPAIDLYKQLIREYPDEVYKYLAENRINALETTDAKDFYAWFHKQDPKPEDRAQPHDGSFDPLGLPPDHPPIRNGMQLPEPPPGLMMPPVSSPTPPVPPESKATTPPVETKPAGETKPADETKPSGDAAPPFPEKKSGDTPTEPTSTTEQKEPPAETPAPSPK